MQVKLIPSTVGEVLPHQYCTSVLIGDSIAIDAGTLGLLSPLSRQKAVRHLFLSHSHIDHIATLPTFLDNIYEPTADCVQVYANDVTIQCLREDVFNDRLWPDFVSLSINGPPFLNLKCLSVGQVTAIRDYSVTAILLDHNIPTFGFIVDSPDATVAFASDTSPTTEFWEILRQKTNLKAVFLECSFPNGLKWLADEACHLCAEQFASELTKVERDVPIYAYHIKPAYYDEISEELSSLGDKRIRIAIPGHQYEF